MSAGFSYSLNSTAMNNVDMYNATYTKDWLFNLSTFGDFNMFNLAKDSIQPLLAVWGWLLFPVIYLTYIACVWLSGGDLFLSLIIALLSMGIVGIIFPSEVFPLILTAVTVSVAVILLRGIQRG